MKPRRLLLLSLLSAVLSAATGCTQDHPTPPPENARDRADALIEAGEAGPLPDGAPRLILIVVIDQLRYDYLTRFEDLYTGGFRTLLDRGALFTEARYRRGVNVTAAGHATIVTGRHPSHHGVVSNRWYDPALGRDVGAVEDSAYGGVGGPGAGKSPRKLLVPTLGDLLKQSDRRSKTVGIGTKDRVAVLLAGRAGDAAYWFSEDCGCFITSTYFSSEAPAWLTKFRAERRVDGYLGKPWTRLLDDTELYTKRSREDAFHAEDGGRNIVFPHIPRTYSRLKETHHYDEFVLDVVVEAMEFHEIGRDDVTDLLAVGFAATDHIGHRFGPFSQEAMDQHLRLDLLLGRLWSEVDKRVGLENTIVILTADHGVAPLAAQSRKKGNAAGGIPSARFREAVNGALAEEFGREGVVAYVYDGHVTLDLEAVERLGLEREEVERVARKALLEIDAVDAVYTHGDLRNEPDRDDPDLYRELYRNAVYDGRSPHLLVQMKPLYYTGETQGHTTHVSAHDYDRHVPIFVMGGGAAPGRYETPSGPEDIAPTLAAMLGLDIEPEPDARVLRELGWKTDGTQAAEPTTP